jgi:peptidoglycan-associated lipoprotein
MKNLIPKLGAALSAAFVFWAAGCAHGPHAASAANGQNPGSESTAAATGAAPSSLDSQGEPSVRESVMGRILQLRTVYFSYDSAALSAQVRSVLRGNASWLKSHADITVQVAGSCDQRGTEQFNLALGQKRAEEVRRYYVMLGVPAGRIATISYGKDKPLCQQSTESCWKRNRRAETLSASPTVAGASEDSRKK